MTGQGQTVYAFDQPRPGGSPSEAACSRKLIPLPDQASGRAGNALEKHSGRRACAPQSAPVTL